MKKIVLLSTAGGLLLVVIIMFILGMGYQNDEVRLVNEYDAQLSKIEATHDNMWKVLQQKAGVTKEYASQFDSIYTHVMDKRYNKNDKVLFNWIKESNPNFDSELYKDLSVSIEIERRKFLGAQVKIIDVVREHNNLLSVIPSRWFLSGRKKLEYEVISSTFTKETMETRTDNKTELF